MTTEEIIKLVLETSGVKGLAELGEQAYKTAEALDEVGEKADEVKAKTLDLQALASKGQGIFSAFQTQDIPGIVKGIGELVDLVPALNTFAPAIKKIGDVAEVAWPQLKGFYDYLTAETVQEAAKAVEDYGTRVDEAGNSISNLTSRKEELAAAEERENKALAEEVKWREKLAGLESSSEAKAQEETERKERAANLQLALGGQQEEVVEEVARGLSEKKTRQLEKQLDKVENAIGDPNTPWKARHDLTAQRSAIRKQLAELQKKIPDDIQNQARDIVSKAIIGGKEEDIQTAIDYMPELGGKGKQFAEEFQRQLPEDTRAWDEEMAKFERENEEYRERKAERRRIAGGKKKDDDWTKNMDAKIRHAEMADEKETEAANQKDLDKREKAARDRMKADQDARKRQTQVITDLGDTFVAQAERALLQSTPKNRNQVQERIKQLARNKLMQQGLAPDQAALEAQDLTGALNNDINRQLGMLRNGMGQRAQATLHDVLGQILLNQAMSSANDAQRLEQLKAQAGAVSAGLQKNRSQQNAGTF